MHRALLAGLLVSVVGSAGLVARQAPVFRGGVDLVNIGVTVTDRKGNLVTDLKPDDFEITENGRKQSIRYFSAGDAAGPDRGEMHLGLVLDFSESMGEDVGFTKTAAIKFLNALLEATDITVVDFDTEVRVGRYVQGEFARLIERIRRQKAAGRTALYDAVGVYLDGASALGGRKIMLLYTDGGDTASVLGFGDLLDLLKASDVTVYAIGELEHQSSWTKNEQRLLIQQIAGATGGQAFFPLSTKALDEVYARVLGEIRAQYTIGYLSTNEKTDGSWRKVDIKVARKDWRVRARKGYYAPYRNGDRDASDAPRR